MRRSTIVLASVLFGAVLWTACGTDDSSTLAGPAPVDPSALPAVTQHCPDGGYKTEVNDGFTSVYKDVSAEKVCVKAGTKIFIATYDGKFGYDCYKVRGLGTYMIKLEETGYSGCKDISYYVIYKKQHY